MGIDYKLLPRKYREQIDRQTGLVKAVVTGLHPAEPEQDPLPSLDKSASVENRVLAKTRVRITRKSTGLLDRDNLYGCVKSLVDGLCKAGLLSGDSEKEIDLEVIQEKVSRQGVGTLIEINSAQS